MSLRDSCRRTMLVWRARRRAQRPGQEHETVVVGTEGVQLWRRVLVCLPSEGEVLADLQEFVENFKRKHPASGVDVLVVERLARQYLNNQNIDHVLTYTPKSFSWLGFPTSAFRDQVLGQAYDLIIDCHRPPDLPLAFLVGLCRRAFRVGIQGEHSQLFYHVAVAPQGTRYLDMMCRTVMLF
jgi:hypothetical protein